MRQLLVQHIREGYYHHHYQYWYYYYYYYFYTWIWKQRTSLVAQQWGICLQCRRSGIWGFDSWVGKIPWRRTPNPLQYSFQKTPMDQGAWQAIVHGVAKSRTQLKQLSKHAWEGQTGFLEGFLASWDFPSTTFPWGCSTWRNAGSLQSPSCPQCVQASCLLLPTPQPQQPLLSKILGSCLCVCSAASNSLQPHGLQPTRFPCPWNFLGRNTGVGCHALFQEIFPTQGLNPHILSPALAGGFFTTSAT